MFLQSVSLCYDKLRKTYIIYARSNEPLFYHVYTSEDFYDKCIAYDTFIQNTWVWYYLHLVSTFFIQQSDESSTELKDVRGTYKHGLHVDVFLPSPSSWIRAHWVTRAWNWCVRISSCVLIHVSPKLSKKRKGWYKQWNGFICKKSIPLKGWVPWNFFKIFLLILVDIGPQKQP